MAVAIAKKSEVDVAYVLEKARVLEVQKSTINASLDGLYLSVAEALCPYKEGQVLVTEKGLGINGLKVEVVVSPAKSVEGNRWAIQTLSYSKAGEITRRGVYIEEVMLPQHGKIKIKS